uniref:Uncharacterized protein n=1 Tax=Cannabis sativa TaxID=3483 RepID=A0A803R9G9_CANSA
MLSSLCRGFFELVKLSEQDQSDYSVEPMSSPNQAIVELKKKTVIKNYQGLSSPHQVVGQIFHQ